MGKNIGIRRVHRRALVAAPEHGNELIDQCGLLLDGESIAYAPTRHSRPGQLGKEAGVGCDCCRDRQLGHRKSVVHPALRNEVSGEVDDGVARVMLSADLLPGGEDESCASAYFAAIAVARQYTAPANGEPQVVIVWYSRLPLPLGLTIEDLGRFCQSDPGEAERADVSIHYAQIVHIIALIVHSIYFNSYALSRALHLEVAQIIELFFCMNSQWRCRI